MERALVEKIGPAQYLPSSTVGVSYLHGHVFHRGFAVQISEIRPKQLSDVEQALAQQIDIVADVEVGPHTREFFKRVPITINPDLDIRLGDYSPQTGIRLSAAIKYGPEMPVLLHELIHAFHHECMPMGYNNPEVRRFYYENWFRTWPHQCWSESKEARFFAMAATEFLQRGERKFNDCETLIGRQPRYYTWLQELFAA